MVILRVGRHARARLRRCLTIAAAASLALSSAVSLAAQRQVSPTVAGQKSTAQQQALDRVRGERAALEARLRILRGSVHDLGEEVDNLARQAAATSDLVVALDGQLVSIDGDVRATTARFARAQHELDGKQVALRRRLVEIYKRGPLYSPEALLSASTFGELVTRFKYLHELALRDRALVRRVESLRDDARSNQALLVRLRAELARSRAEKASEEDRLRSLESMRATSLAQARQQASRTGARLAQIARDEARLSGVIATLEAARKSAESGPTRRPGASRALEPGDGGRLGWPVDGPLLYRFGRVVSANNTTTRWNGVGIAAPAGSPVRAVAAGAVVLAEAMGTYGLTVIVQHGGGDYLIYGSLARADVRKGAAVSKGQAIGTVGRADPELPPHLHFEVRPNGHAVDPLTWLRERR